MTALENPKIPLPCDFGYSMRSCVKSIYMIGIGGAGMAGIAEVLLNLNFVVSGSDISANANVQRLETLGASIYLGHSASNINGVDVVVKSTAIGEDNPEVIRAREMGIPVIPRAEMLAELMRLQTGIAVAGTHGKTTTTSLIASIFNKAKQDPTVIIGGKLNAFGANARLGTGKYIIAEADESDGSFLCLPSILNVVTNIDLDHLEFYESQEKIDLTFLQFLNSIPFYGKNIVCGDDVGVKRLIPQMRRPFLTYGFEKENTLRAEIISMEKESHFRVFKDNKFLQEITLPHPGKHNILNALAAIAIAIEANIDLKYIRQGLEEFTGVDRRFQKKGEVNGILIIDDYGHHPVEIKATLQAAKMCYPDRRLVVAFQPHRFSRTQALFGDFCKAFDLADKLVITEIYAASESPIPGISGESLVQGVKQVSKVDVSFQVDYESVEKFIDAELRENDLFLTLGAGGVYIVGEKYLKKMSEK